MQAESDDEIPLEPAGPPERTWVLKAGPGGRISVDFSGKPSFGEANTVEIANLVVLTLNANGASWGTPRKADPRSDDADLISDGPEGQLRMQVTRVPHAPERWAALARQGSVQSTLRPYDLAVEMIEAIRTKAAHYSGLQKTGLVLVLDGSAGMAYELPPTLQEFRTAFLNEAQGAGFDDILLVGMVRMVSLVDPPVGNVWFSLA